MAGLGDRALELGVERHVEHDLAARRSATTSALADLPVAVADASCGPRAVDGAAMRAPMRVRAASAAGRLRTLIAPRLPRAGRTTRVAGR